MRSPHRFNLLFLFFAVIIAYANSFRAPFHFDDYHVIVHNFAVHSPAAWAADLSGGIRPLLKFTYMVNWIQGPAVFWFHLFNLLIHVANCGLVYALLVTAFRHRGPMEGRERGIALLTALLFGLHPVQTEAVTYISGRSISLMAFFYLAAILAYIRGVEESKPLQVFILSPLFFLLALLTRETATTLPIALLLWESTRVDKDRTGKVLLRQAPHYVLLILALGGLLFHPGHGRLMEYSFDIRSIGDNLLTQINGVTYLFSQIIMIHRLNVDPDLPVLSAWTWRLGGQTLFLVMVAAAGIACWRKRPWISFGVFWFFLHLLPTNSIAPRLDVANDRHLYLPAMGIFFLTGTALVVLGDFLKEKKVHVQAVVVVLLLFLGASTVARNHVYRSEIALWEDTQRKSPHKARAYNNLGCAYAAAGRKEEAAAAYGAALLLEPDYHLARKNLNKLAPSPATKE